MRRPSSNPNNPVLYAKNKVMDLVAKRDHSEKELRTKLRNSFRWQKVARKKRGQELSDEDQSALDSKIDQAIDEAIEFARSNGWLLDSEVLAEKMAGMLHRRNKGIKYINNFLHGKGLPGVKSEHDLELEKALALVKNKYSGISELSYEEKRKEQGRIARFLIARGFDSDVVRKVIYEEL